MQHLLLQTFKGRRLYAVVCIALALFSFHEGRGQNSGDLQQDEKQLSESEYELVTNSAKELISGYVDYLNLIPLLDQEERIKTINTLETYVDDLDMIVINDLDPTKTTEKVFKLRDYLENVTSFYPDGVEITVGNDEINISEPFFDKDKGRYFVKGQITRILNGFCKINEKDISNNLTPLDFYIGMSAAGEKTRFSIYSITDHEDNEENFMKVAVMPDAEVEGKSFYSEEEMAKLQTEKEEIESKNKGLQDQVSNLKQSLEEEKEKRRQAEIERAREEERRKAAEELRKAEEERRKEAEKRARELEARKRAIAELEKRKFGRAQYLYHTFDSIMSQKQVRNVVYRAGSGWFKTWKDSSEVYYNAIREFKEWPNSPDYNVREVNTFVGQMKRFRDRIDSVYRSDNQIRLAGVYEKIRSKNRKVLIKLGVGFMNEIIDGDAIEGMPEADMSFHGTLALRFGGRYMKRGHLFGLFVNAPYSSDLGDGNSGIMATEFQLGFSIKEFFRISGGFGSLSQDALDQINRRNLGTDSEAGYGAITAGISTSFWRVLEVDALMTAMTGGVYAERGGGMHLRFNPTVNLIFKLGDDPKK